MSEHFDAYYKWLGIPPSEQPPNHYRLLGVNLYEPDGDVIANSAERQMVHVRSCRLGPHGADCERLLNELAAARLVLLTDTEKAEYDKSLRARFESEKPAVPAPPVVATDRVSRQPQPVRSSKAVPVVVACVVVVVIGVLFFAFARQPEPKSAALSSLPATQPETPQVFSSPLETLPPQTVEPAESIPPEQPLAAPEPTDGITPPVVDEPAPAEVQAAPRVTPTTSSPAAQPEPAERSLADLVVSESKPLASLSDEQIAAALAQVKAEFREALAGKRTFEESQRLAESIMESAIRADVAADRRYALLLTASDVAASAGAVESVKKAFTHLEATTDRDQIAAKVAAFASIAQQIEEPEQHFAMVDYLEDAIDESVRKDRFDLAVTVAESALQSARRSRNTDAATRVANRLKEVRQGAIRFEPIAQAQQQLQSVPDDPQANELVGEYLCLVKGEWERGLPLLAKGNSGALREVALDETSSVGSMEPNRIADAWLHIASEQSDVAKMNALLRAEHWFRQAASTADNTQRVNIETRLSAIDRDIGKVATLPSGAILLMPFEPGTIDNRDGQLVVDDASLHSYHGVVRGTKIVPGIAGNALGFARPDFVEIDGLAWLQQSRAGFTISVWVWANSLQGPKKQRHDYILSNDVLNPKKSSGYVLRLALDRRPDFTCRAQKWREVVLDQPLTLKAWHHLAVTHHESIVSLYLDGQPHGRITLLGALVASDKPLRLGNSGHLDGRGFNGMIDELAFFKRALSADEVRLLYLRGLAGRPLVEKE